MTFGNAGYLREAAALHPGRPAAGRDRRALPHARCRTAAGPTPPAWCRTPSAPSPRSPGADLAELCAGLTAHRRTRLRPLVEDLPSPTVAGSRRDPAGRLAPAVADRRRPRCPPEARDTGTVGRLIAVVLFIAVLVPGRAAVAGVVAGVRPPGRRRAAPSSSPSRPPRARRRCAGRPSTAGGSAGWASCSAWPAWSAACVMFAEASVFLWVPALAVGLLAGVLLAEATRPAAALGDRDPGRAARGSAELISGWLVWTMRAVAAAELVAAGVAVVAAATCPTRSAGSRSSCRPRPGCWPRLALLRALLRPLPAEGADVPVDEALRTWTAHLVTAAASVLAMLPLGTLLLVAGIDLGDRVTESVDLLPVALVAGGFSALAAGRRGGRFPAPLAAPGPLQRAGPRRLNRCSPARDPAGVHPVGLRHRASAPASTAPPAPSGHVVTQGVGAPTQCMRSSLLHSLCSHCHSYRLRYRVVTDQPGWRPTRAVIAGSGARAPRAGRRPETAVSCPGPVTPWKCRAPFAPAQPVRPRPARTRGRHRWRSSSPRRP